MSVRATCLRERTEEYKEYAEKLIKWQSDGGRLSSKVRKYFSDIGKWIGEEDPEVILWIKDSDVLKYVEESGECETYEIHLNDLPSGTSIIKIEVDYDNR